MKYVLLVFEDDVHPATGESTDERFIRRFAKYQEFRRQLESSVAVQMTLTAEEEAEIMRRLKAAGRA